MKHEQPQNQAIKLVAIKVVHTIVWAFLALCVLAIPVASWYEMHIVAGLLIAVVLLETLVLLINSWNCPLTTVAAKYTDQRKANFDIYLPEWLARNNKVIFGGLFCAGTLFAIVRWMMMMLLSR